MKFKFMLLESGFNVAQANLSAPHNVTWFLFEKNGILGYCQIDSFFGLGFSSVNKPDRVYGVGTSISRHLINPTVHDAEEVVRRQWSHFELELYNSLEDYISDPANKWAKYSIIYSQQIR